MERRVSTEGRLYHIQPGITIFCKALEGVTEALTGTVGPVAGFI